MPEIPQQPFPERKKEPREELNKEGIDIEQGKIIEVEIPSEHTKLARKEEISIVREGTKVRAKEIISPIKTLEENLTKLGYGDIKQISSNPSSCSITYSAINKDGNTIILKVYSDILAGELERGQKVFIIHKLVEREKEVHQKLEMVEINVPKLLSIKEITIPELQAEDIPASGKVYILEFEKVEGESLSKFYGEKRLHIKEIIDILKQGLEIIDTLQSVGLIHRDLRPENFIYNRETGKLYLLDLNLAIPIQLADKTTFTLIQPGGGWYPLESYISPSFSSDPAALGIIIISLLLGPNQTLLQGSSENQFIDSLITTLLNQLKDNNIVPQIFIEFLEKLTNPDAKKRYPNARLALEDLDRVIKGKPIRGRGIFKNIKEYIQSYFEKRSGRRARILMEAGYLEEAFKLIEDIRRIEVKESLYDELFLNAIGHHNYDLALRVLGFVSIPNKQSFTKVLITMLANEGDIQMLVRLFSTIEEGYEKDRLIESVLDNLPFKESNAENILDIILQIKSDGLRDKKLLELIENFLNSKIEISIKAHKFIRNTESKDIAIGKIIKKLIESNRIMESIELLDDISNLDLKLNLIDLIISKLLDINNIDPANIDLAIKVAEKIHDKTLREEMVQKIYKICYHQYQRLKEEYVKSPLIEALDKLLGIMDKTGIENRDNELIELYKITIGIDIKAALKIITKIGDAEKRDLLLQEIIQILVERDNNIELALNALGLMSNESLISSIIEKYLSKILLESRGALEQQIQSYISISITTEFGEYGKRLAERLQSFTEEFSSLIGSNTGKTINHEALIKLLILITDIANYPRPEIITAQESMDEIIGRYGVDFLIKLGKIIEEGLKIDDPEKAIFYIGEQINQVIDEELKKRGEFHPVNKWRIVKYLSNILTLIFFEYKRVTTLFEDITQSTLEKYEKQTQKILIEWQTKIKELEKIQAENKELEERLRDLKSRTKTTTNAAEFTGLLSEIEEIEKQLKGNKSKIESNNKEILKLEDELIKLISDEAKIAFILRTKTLLSNLSNTFRLLAIRNKLNIDPHILSSKNLSNYAYHITEELKHKVLKDLEVLLTSPAARSERALEEARMSGRRILEMIGLASMYYNFRCPIGNFYTNVDYAIYGEGLGELLGLPLDDWFIIERGGLTNILRMRFPSGSWMPLPEKEEENEREILIELLRVYFVNIVFPRLREIEVEINKQIESGKIGMDPGKDTASFTVRNFRLSIKSRDIKNMACPHCRINTYWDLIVVGGSSTGKIEILIT